MKKRQKKAKKNSKNGPKIRNFFPAKREKKCEFLAHFLNFFLLFFVFFSLILSEFLVFFALLAVRALSLPLDAVPWWFSILPKLHFLSCAKRGFYLVLSQPTHSTPNNSKAPARKLADQKAAPKALLFGPSSRREVRPPRGGGAGGGVIVYQKTTRLYYFSKEPYYFPFSKKNPQKKPRFFPFSIKNLKK